MKILIQSPLILDPNSPFHQKEKNVLVSNGRITEIGDKNYTADKVIRAEGMLLSPGWFDLGTFVGDPGLEHKEDLNSAARAAAAGGFTEIAVLPNTVPAVQTKNEISYLMRNNENRLVQVHVLASVTRNNKGEELTEMIDLHEAGAVGFTDGLKPIWHTDIMLKALQYLQKFNGVLIDHPEDNWLNMFGQMHEGINSTRLGLKGMPRIAEEIVVSKYLELLAYAGGRLHFSRISTAKSVELIKAARKKLNVSCDVTAYQPLLEDSLLVDFDTNYKVNPPLREKADNDALIKGLKEGSIDVICSGHVAHDDESKNLEFDLADFGIISLQTFGANLVSLSRNVDWDVLIEKVTVGPRRVLNLEMPRIEEDTKANLTLFDPQREWVLDEKSNSSKSKNSPWFGQQLRGKAVAVFNNTKHAFDL
ncbi:dihydroorotase [Fulvivirgaceae bacterium PWU4]|uniref:Dihydroorotase n=1 Tax=Chryseosolibacter histidini TaxID=2782349 RepID=A0AAP2DP95_9BACT|nr:dihydroorotase [Chryseosolibacter histidini]MBT1698487.1 dihydroorotase [Chryseosolibacter histidini]